jgi:hypothetical protein
MRRAGQLGAVLLALVIGAAPALARGFGGGGFHGGGGGFHGGGGGFHGGGGGFHGFGGGGFHGFGGGGLRGLGGLHVGGMHLGGMHLGGFRGGLHGLQSLRMGGLHSFTHARSFHSFTRAGGFNRSVGRSFSHRGNRFAARSFARGNRSVARSFSRGSNARLAGRNLGRNAAARTALARANVGRIAATRTALARGNAAFAGRNAARAAFATHSALGAHAAGNALMSHRFANAGFARNGPIGSHFWGARWSSVGWFRNWRHNRLAFGWWGPVFWPFAYYDLFADLFWPYGYWPYFYDPFWYYGYPDLYTSLFWPYDYNDIVGPPPGAAGAGGNFAGTYPGRTSTGPAYAAAPSSGYPPRAPASTVRGTTQTAMGRYSEYCGDDSRDVAGVPVDEIQQTVNPTDEQRAALDELGNASVQAAQIIKASCPTDVSLTPIGRIEAMQQRVQAMLNAVKVVRAPLEKFYNMLTDEQKARFNALAQNQRPPEGEGGATVSGGSPVAGCRNRAIPDWPTAQIQRTLHPTPAQQTALDALQDAAGKAKDILEASCPTEMPATPLARLSAIEQRLQTILAAIETVRGPLNTFYSSLSDEQKAQFNKIGRTATKQG